MEVTISRDLEIPKDSIQTLNCQCAYMMSQVINYYKDVKSGHIIITTLCCIIVRDGAAICQSKYTFTSRIITSRKRT